MTLIAQIALLANLTLTGLAPAAAMTAATAAPAAAPQTGEVTHYGPPRSGRASLMVRVWNWRIYQGHVPECPECVDAVALVDPQYIGQKVWLRHPNGEVVGPLMVADCAEAKHRPNLRKRGWVADISWELAQRWEMNGPLEGVTVLFEEPDRVDVMKPITRPTSCPATGCTKTNK